MCVWMEMRKRRRLDGSDGTCTRRAAAGSRGGSVPSDGLQTAEYLSFLPLGARVRVTAVQVTFTGGQRSRLLAAPPPERRSEVGGACGEDLQQLRCPACTCLPRHDKKQERDCVLIRTGEVQL